MKHTSTPWTVSLEPVSSPYGNSLIVQPATEKVGSVGICWGKGNAEFIVKAVNEHAALVAVAEVAMKANGAHKALLTESDKPQFSELNVNLRHQLNTSEDLSAALATLAAVRAGQQESEVGK